MERFSVRFSLKLFFVAFLCFLLASSSWANQEGPSQSEKEELPTWEQKAQPEREEFLTRGQKTLLLNVGGMATIVAYGAWQWGYGKETFQFKNEGWFQRDTKYGGADKLGHFWSSYALSHLYSYFYRKWGYTDSEANLYGALSNLGFQTFMEVADGFSSQGFSYQDLVMNIVGSGVGYIWGKYPSVARKIDFRIEYMPYFDHRDYAFSTKYDRQTFLIAVKADGFDAIKNPYLQYLEFHMGYKARGYKDYEVGAPDDRRRSIYVGLGLNVSKLLQKYVDTRVLDYIQIPYTSVRKTVTSD